MHSPVSPAGGRKRLLLNSFILDSAFKKKEAAKEQQHQDDLRKTVSQRKKTVAQRKYQCKLQYTCPYIKKNMKKYGGEGRDENKSD